MHTIPSRLMDSLTTDLRNMNVLAKDDDSYFNKLIRILKTRCMTQVVYFCSGYLTPQEFLHYGLAASLYFTSQIRRYMSLYTDCLLQLGDL
ncbi:hypothetical protein MKW92_027925 [Papaver armeniacum]|nr:hypothetical protein MKW92_027925 [Papaver armeniacum]